MLENVCRKCGAKNNFNNSACYACGYDFNSSLDVFMRNYNKVVNTFFKSNTKTNNDFNTQNNSETNIYKKIRGLLIPIVLLYIISLLIDTFNLINLYIYTLVTGFHFGSSIDFNKYYWIIILVFSVNFLFCLCTIVYKVILLKLFFKRKRSFPKIAIIFHIIMLFFSLTNYFFIISENIVGVSYTFPDLNLVIFPILICIACVTYYAKSKRVKFTFVE